jgi:hypothetical protein
MQVATNAENSKMADICLIKVEMIKQVSSSKDPETPPGQNPILAQDRAKRPESLSIIFPHPSLKRVGMDP